MSPISLINGIYFYTSTKDSKRRRARFKEIEARWSEELRPGKRETRWEVLLKRVGEVQDTQIWEPREEVKALRGIKAEEELKKRMPKSVWDTIREQYKDELAERVKGLDGDKKEAAELSFFGEKSEEVLQARIANLREEDKTEAKLRILNRQTHQKEIRGKLEALLAYPQVRERFDREFREEFKRYEAARFDMGEVRDIDRLVKMGREVIYTEYLKNKRGRDGKIDQSVVDKIGEDQKELRELEKWRKGKLEIASFATRGYLETQKLLEYKRQVQENGVALTPSRLDLIDRIMREAVAGNKIFLVGSTGTGILPMTR